ncbi:restriction endonuclease [Candidatus Bipolaricaulota bacterium]|nr:restriction endonuclease [Candidatus Bipolaricaulota bacterium]
MSADFANLIEPYVFSSAVREFWETRERQASAQRQRGQLDRGLRAAVTGGQQMNGFAKKIAELMIKVGVDPGAIYTHRMLTDLPGFFRPSKEWDLIVVSGGKLLAAVELKAQVGPSFGNNFNNRAEEALGSSMDIWTAYRERAFQTTPRPFLGFLFLLEDAPGSRAPVKVREPHFPVFPEFQGASYAKRYELFCRKIVLERQYTAACFLMSAREKAAQRENYTEPAEDLSATAFLSELLRHVAHR